MTRYFMASVILLSCTIFLGIKLGYKVFFIFIVINFELLLLLLLLSSLLLLLLLSSLFVFLLALSCCNKPPDSLD